MRECALDLRLGATVGEDVSIDMVGCDPLPVFPSTPSSILMSFPCLELGGGGFLRPAADCTFASGDDGVMVVSSGSEISWEVRGVPCIVSSIDRRDTELASVVLALSWAVGC